MSQQGWSRGPRYGQRDDWWSQLYDPGSPDTGSTRSGDTLDDRYASVRRTMNPGTGAPVRKRGAEPPTREPGTGPERPAWDEQPAGGEEPQPDPRTAAPPPEPSSPAAGTADTRYGVDASDAPSDAPSDALYGADVPTVAEPYEPRGPQPPEPPVGESAESPEPPPGPAAYVGDRPPTYAAEPATLPEADPSALSELVPDTVLDGAHYAGLTLRAASLRGDSARHRGALRRDALLTARFGEGRSALLLVAVAAGGRTATGGHRAARELCNSVAAAVGRSHARLAEDVRAGRRDALKPGLQRLTERCYGKLRAQAAALGLQPEEYTAELRCLLLSADPRCATRIVFGAGAGGYFLLRGGAWHDLEADPSPAVASPGGAGEPYPSALDPSELGDLAALSVPVTGSTRRPDGAEPPGRPPAAPDMPAPVAPAAPPVPPVPSVPGPSPASFRFCAVTARPADVLILCSPGFAEPLRAVPDFAHRLADVWSDRARQGEPPGLAAYLADVQLRVRGYAEDRTTVAVWET